MSWFAILCEKLLSLVEANSGKIAALVAYLAGKRSMANEINSEQEKQDLQLENDYLKNRTDPRTPDDTIGRVQDGSF
jgi:hypothetical protein